MERIPKLIVSDLDGTIFDKTYTLAEELVVAVQTARQKGCQFTFATGRLYPSAVQFAVRLGLSIPLIAYNGALVRNPITDENIMELPLPREKALEIIDLTEGHPVMRFIFKDDIVYTDVDPEVTRQYAQALNVPFERHTPLRDVLDKDPTMIALRADPQEIVKWTKCFRQHFVNELYMANSRPFFLDIAHPRVSKGCALQYLCNHLQIDPAEVIAIGDEENDLEMMAVAGMGVAVNNGSPKVRQAADYVTEAEYWRGVIEVIERFVLNEGQK